MAPQVVDVDDEDVEKDIYNMAVAGKTAFGADVQRDAFGVALGSDFDLATPGSRCAKGCRWHKSAPRRGAAGGRHEAWVKHGPAHCSAPTPLALRSDPRGSCS